MSDVQTLPIFPLGSVLFPGGRLALRVFEPRYVDMTKACIRDSTVFGVTLIKAGFEVGAPAIPYDIGCTARIVDWDMPSPNMFTLVAEGIALFRIVDRHTQDDGLIVAETQLIDPPDPTPLPARHEPMAALLRRLVDEVGAGRLMLQPRFDDAVWVAYRVTELLPIAPERKQAVLELDEPAAMLGEVERLLKDLRED